MGVKDKKLNNPTLKKNPQIKHLPPKAPPYPWCYSDIWPPYENWHTKKGRDMRFTSIEYKEHFKMQAPVYSW